MRRGGCRNRAGAISRSFWRRSDERQVELVLGAYAQLLDGIEVAHDEPRQRGGRSLDLHAALALELAREAAHHVRERVRIAHAREGLPRGGAKRIERRRPSVSPAW
jgi:hypothetical protein